MSRSATEDDDPNLGMIPETYEDSDEYQDENNDEEEA